MGTWREFSGERCDVSIPMIKDLGQDLREHWANLCQSPNANIHMTLGLGGYSS